MLKNNFKYLIFVFCCMSAISCEANDSPEDRTSREVQVEVGDVPVTVYDARVSKFPQNKNWDGKPRPLEQTEIAHFAYFDYTEGATVRITSSRKIDKCTIRPTEYGIVPKITGNTVEFKLPGPCQTVVEFDGHYEALHLFANPEKLSVDKTEATRYFKPGVHNAGLITVGSNETIYIDEGAIVYGAIRSENASNIKIVGKGILDASRMSEGHIISLEGVKDALIEGIIMKEPLGWAVVPYYCDGVTFDNVKLIGFWRSNTDGIDIVNSKNVTIRNSFVRSFDDCITFKGQKGVYDSQQNARVMENITVDNCVLWNDWGKCFEFGAETVVDEIRNVNIRNCFIPHFTMVAMSIQNGDRARVHDVHFENISVEEPIMERAMLNGRPYGTDWWGTTIGMEVMRTEWSQDEIRGNIDNITFKNIRHIGTVCRGVSITGLDADHKTKDIHITDYSVHGVKVDSKDNSYIKIGDYTENVIVD